MWEGFFDLSGVALVCDISGLEASVVFPQWWPP